MAGGKGVRLSSVTNDEIPKPMVRLLGKPVLEHQIEVLKRNGITKLFISVGYLGNKIEEYFGTGDKFGVEIEYIREDMPLGSAGSLFYVKDRIDDDFLVVFGDTIFDISIDLMHEFHIKKNAVATLFVHPNSHPYDSDIVVTDDDSKVIKFDSKNNVRNYFYDNCVNAGFYMFSSEVLKYFTELRKMDLEKDLLFDLCGENGNVFAYLSTEYIKDVGTPDRLDQVEKHIETGLVSGRNLSNKQKCIFLDRDGVLNKVNGFINSPDQLDLEDDAVDAVSVINNCGYLAVVITNQPVVARGMCTLETLHDINKKLQTLLGREHVYVDDIFMCLHHPDKGYPEEDPTYKIECDCRKPKPGMILNAAAKYNIDLSKSWFIGDRTTDVLCGINAGVKTVLLKTGEAGADKTYDVVPDLITDNLLDAVNMIVNGEV